MRRATPLQTPPKRCVAFPPKKYRDFKMPHLALYHPKCYVVSQHAALRLGILHRGVYSTPPFTARFTQQLARYAPVWSNSHTQLSGWVAHGIAV